MNSRFETARYVGRYLGTITNEEAIPRAAKATRFPAILAWRGVPLARTQQRGTVAGGPCAAPSSFCCCISLLLKWWW